MGLTNQSTGKRMLEHELKIATITSAHKIVALAGNPNVGKSTIFNSLTGLKQHTGNWPGKTVTNAQGSYIHKDKNFTIVDLPGTYSIMSNSIEEEVARDFICFGNPEATVIVADATCLERNLNLVLQTIEITNNVVVCVNLIDEAKRKNIHINLKDLSLKLGIPIVGTNARKGTGLNELMDIVYDLTTHTIKPSPISVKYDECIEEAIKIVEPYVNKNFDTNILNSRWISLKLIEGDQSLLESLNKYIGVNLMDLEIIVQKLEEAKIYLLKNNISNDILRDRVVTSIVHLSEEICNKVINFKDKKYNDFDRKLDSYLTSKVLGIPIMICLLGFIFWLTIVGANYPSTMLSNLFFSLETKLTQFFMWIGTPSWVHGILVLGAYRTVAWVIAVMLPPMAIFFPLFTLLEDLGYLPRVAFNMDNYFKRSCACGKQSLTMCMGFGCNAAGIIGCRIINSPRERLIAIITNNFVPCNGRFPTLIAIITMFFAGVAAKPYQSIFSTLILLAIIILGVVMTLIISKLLSKTILKGIPSSFTLELPPYRKPQIGKVIIHSIFDRTLFVLGRALVVAVPAGIVIWIMANIHIGDPSLLDFCASFLQPFANAIGLDGYILMAFILGFPANEIVVPIIIMSYMSTGSLIELDSLVALKELLISHNWTWLTALCVMLFSLMHWPCGTTCLTIKKETQSKKWTFISFIIPTVTGITICFVVTSIVRFLHLV